ncbi:MAG: endonuclease/exonuclease/phosphatase family protein [Phycisphaerales bacterium]|nr:endonuclease/exonuclease/phosphatase family protein [Phycisphaerales bacterium]
MLPTALLISRSLARTALLLPLALAACSSTPAKVETSRDRLDGAVVEWSSGTVARADEHYLHFRFSVGPDTKTIQASDETIALLLDVDGRSDTGYQRTPKPFNSIGADLELQFSPTSEKGAVTTGVEFYALDKNGTRTELPKDQSDLTFSPAYASAWYEARMSRAFAAKLTKAGMASSGKGRGILVIYAPNEGGRPGGRIAGYSEPFDITFPPIAPGPKLADAAIPAKPKGTIRVMSWNVWGKMASDPLKFAPILRAINPDVILISEWKSDEKTLVDATSAVFGSTWSGVSAGDVAIASRFPLAPSTAKAEVLVDGKPRSVRYVAAVAQSPIGGVLVGAMHLKCCGGAGSSEDQLRLAEARAINDTVKQASRADAATIRVLGGDLNLVGSRNPLDLLRADIDLDASDLTPADPAVLGDNTYYTWRDWNTGFSPGRLDWLTYSDATATIVQSFVLDTRRLTPAALSSMGLTTESSDVSDHLPVVIDIAPIAK